MKKICVCKQVVGKSDIMNDGLSRDVCVSKWNKYVERIEDTLEKATAENLIESIEPLFRSFLTWTWGVFARSLYEKSMRGYVHTQISTSLLAVINSKLPDVGQSVVLFVLFRLKRGLIQANSNEVRRASVFITECYRQRIVSAPLVVQILVALISEREYLPILLQALFDIAPVLQIDDKNTLSVIFQELFKYSDDASISSDIQKLMVWRQMEWTKHVNGKSVRYVRIPKKFDLIEEEDQICHDGLDFDEIDGDVDPTGPFCAPHKLDIFPSMKAEYKQFLAGLFSAEEEEEEREVKQASDSHAQEESMNQANEALQQNIVKNEELQIKRRVYLTIVSNVTSNATAHTLLKLSDEVGPDNERIIINTCIDYSGMERTFNRDLGVLIELMCRGRPSFVPLVENGFVKTYIECHKFTLHRMINLACLFAYLLGRGVIGWHVMCVLRLTEEDTTSAQRVFIKYLMEELAKNMSHETLLKKLSQPEVIESTSDLFLADTLDHAEFCYAFFNEINLGFLCERLRERIEKMNEEEEQRKAEELAAIRMYQERLNKHIRDSSSSE